MYSSIKKYYFNCTQNFNYLNTTYCGTFIAPSNFTHGPINSDKYILTYIKKGKGIFNFSGKSYYLEAGYSYIIFPDYIFSHVADSEDPWTFCWFDVYGSVLQNLLQLLELTPNNPVYKHTNTQIADQITDDIIYKCNINNIICEVQRIGLLYRFFSESILDISQPKIETPLLEHVQSNIYIRTAIKYISHNYEKDVSVDTIAHHVGLDRSYFGRMFKEMVGCTPSYYIMSYRINKAKFLFMNTNYKIEEIASLVGYKNVCGFYKNFKMIVGISVSEYRKKMSSGEFI